jgi:glycosyltransferase involved in cell wall biosynthesis
MSTAVTGRRRLLFVGPLPDPVTGQSLACSVLLEDLRRDHDVEVINLNRGLYSKAGKFGVFVHTLMLLGKIIKMNHMSRDADIVYFNNVETLFGTIKDMLFYLAAFDRLNRTVVHLHGGAGMREIMSGRWPILAELNRFFLQRLGAMVVLGPRLVDIYSPHLSADRIKVAANFAEDRWFAENDQIREKHVGGRPISLLFLSNLLEGKGHLELAQAFLNLEPELRSCFRLDFAGGCSDPASEAAFRQMIAEAPEVTYHGTVKGDAKQALLSAAHVFCLPTYYAYEGQPISILEAYAAGAAVITTDHSGIFDIFEDGVNGWAVEMRSVASLEARLRGLAADRSVMLPIALTNAGIARSTYRVEAFLGRMRQILDAVGPRSTPNVSS